MRIILYTGKGGVGKTSIAAATACRLSALGQKVLAVSTDQAHSLSDSFGIALGSEAVPISENLYGMEIDVVRENEKHFANLSRYIERLMTLKAESSIETEELLVFPGFEELLSLVKIKQLYESGEYDTIIVDCAPTGETMSLLKFPEMFRYWIDKLLPGKRKAARIVRPVIESTIKVPLPDDDTFDEFEALYAGLCELHTLFTNQDVVSLRIVTTPENIVIREAKRSFCYLHLFNYNVDAIIVNRVFPADALSGYFNRWEALQENSLLDIAASFPGLPIFPLELQSGELRTLPELWKAGELLYGESNPSEIFFRDTIFDIKKEGDTWLYRVHMPFAEKEELQLSQSGDELSITVKNERRNFSLPLQLHGLEITKAKYEDGVLCITFR